MDAEYARSRAKFLVETASSKRDSREPVSDDTWSELLEIGKWAKEHAPKPSLLTHAIPSSDSTRSWLTVKHSAQAILDSLNGDEGEGQNRSRIWPPKA